VGQHFCESQDKPRKVFKINISLTKAENGKNCFAIFTIFRHLSGASRRSNGVIELTLKLRNGYAIS